jgi:hypothetical protein
VTSCSVYLQLPSIAGGHLLHMHPEDVPCFGHRDPPNVINKHRVLKICAWYEHYHHKNIKWLETLMCVCVCVCVLIYVSIYLSVCLSVRPSAHLPTLYIEVLPFCCQIFVSSYLDWWHCSVPHFLC